MCNGWVNRVMANNPAKDIRFGAKQGTTFQLAAERFPEVAKVDSIVVIEYQADGTERPLIRSRAVYSIVKHVQKLGAIRTLLSITPTIPADIGYCFVSKIRYYVFGRSDACRLPKPEERVRFVD
jgi:predicted DCC family thiol-disulfide oxidoreductase YuxK